MKINFNKILHQLLDFFEITLICCLVFFTVYLFVGQLVEVSGNSMEPNFHNGQQILAEKFSLNITNLKRGDVIIFENTENNRQNRRLLIKRIIGLPNETTKIENGQVYIDDKILEEPYLKKDTYTNLKSDYKLKEGEEYKIGEDS